MLVLEVKGGGIGYDGVKDLWTSTNAEKEIRKIKNPATQATINKHELLKKLQQLPGWGKRFINARIGVVFPQSHVPGDLAPNLPRYVVAGVKDMPKLGAWIEQRLIGDSESTDSRVVPLGTDGLSILDAFFAGSFQLEQPLAATLLQVDTELRILTERQALLLDMLQHHKRLAIPGAAGTGKTSLAVEKARRLARTGLRTLLLCYNRPLAVHLRAQVGEQMNLEVASFHAFVAKLARRLDIPTPDGERDVRRPDRAWADLLCSVLDRLPEERYDAIVVDEGQDLDEGWLGSVEALLRDADEGVLYVFYDDNQKVHGRAASLGEGIRKCDVHLNRILRNSKPIAESFRTLLPNEIAIDGPDGPPVEFRTTGDSVGQGLVDVVSELIEQRHVAPDQIAILFADAATRDRFTTGNALGRWEVTNAELLPQGQIICESVRRFKGLERSVVILVEPSAYCDEAEMLYVGMSRARSLLVLLDTESGVGRLRAALEASD
jgi:hypothetical protein